jgi:glucuronate isomerase
MTKFMTENFLLSNPTAISLFHEYARDLPIIDYHCHIQQHEVVQNKQFANLTQVWLYGDHYKWRAMRSCGVEEKYITGNASDYEKYLAWAKIMPNLIGNPLYHWTHLELQRYFDIYDILNEDNAPKIWEIANKKLMSGSLNVLDIIKHSKVEVVCTTDDPVDDLSDHILLRSNATLKVLPTFRPDNALAINNPQYLSWLSKLSAVSKVNITDYNGLLNALELRIKYFASVGCKLSDHGMNYVPFAITNTTEVADIYNKVIHGNTVSLDEETKFRSHTMAWLAKQYATHDWTMQLHMNVTRNNNTKMFELIGPDTGFDAINDAPIANELAGLLNSMNNGSGLPKTILYSLNHNDNYVIATIMGAFQNSEARGKIQLGSGWWFNDQRDGMEEQLKTLANLGALGTFVGMLTDSRSFLSYTRHEYFRRILCNLIGTWVENGEYPNDKAALKTLIQNICYYNAKQYFGFGE